jgi:hypothetical protein
MSSEFEEHLEKALTLFKNIRKRAVEEGIDPKAFRVALKAIVMIDDMVAMQFISEDEERELNQLAIYLVKMLMEKGG